MKKFLKWTAIVLGGLSLLVALARLILSPLGIKKLNPSYPNIAVDVDFAETCQVFRGVRSL